MAFTRKLQTSQICLPKLHAILYKHIYLIYIKYVKTLKLLSLVLRCLSDLTINISHFSNYYCVISSLKSLSDAPPQLLFTYIK